MVTWDYRGSRFSHPPSKTTHGETARKTWPSTVNVTEIYNRLLDNLSSQGLSLSSAPAAADVKNGQGL